MERYQWPDGYDAAFCVTVDVDAESPQIWRSRATGITGLNQLEQRRYGLREGIYRILDLFDRYAVKATCFVPAYEAITRPWLLEHLHKRGHELGLHGYYHEVVTELSADQFRETLERAQAVFRSQVGLSPLGYRSPSWQMPPWAFRVLRDLGIGYDSSLSGYDHPYCLDGMTEIPIQWPLDDAIFFRYTGEGNDRWPPMSTATQVAAWVEAGCAICREAGVLVPTFHPWLSGRPLRLALVEKMLERFTAENRIWKATLGEVASWHENSKNFHRFQETADIPDLPGDWPGAPTRS